MFSLYSSSLQITQADTSTLLNLLSDKTYRASPSKVQLSTPQVTYLGLAITSTYKPITLDRKHLTQPLTSLTTKEEILSLQGMAGFLCYWIPSFSFLAGPLYEAACGTSQEHPLAPFHKLQWALPARATNEQDELIVLTCAFQLAKGLDHVKPSFWSDSSCWFDSPKAHKGTSVFAAIGHLIPNSRIYLSSCFFPPPALTICLSLPICYVSSLCFLEPAMPSGTWPCGQLFGY